MTDLSTVTTETAQDPTKAAPTPAEEGTEGSATSAPSAAKDEKKRPKRTAIAKRRTKASKVEAMLARKSGVTLHQICEATDWQAHTSRAFISGLRKKGQDIVRETGKAGKSTYRLGPANSAAKAR